MFWIQLSKFNNNTYTVYNIRQQPKGNYGAVLSDVWVCRKSKMAAINRKLIWYNVYISTYSWLQRNFNGYSNIFEVQQLSGTSPNTARGMAIEYTGWCTVNTLNGRNAANVR